MKALKKNCTALMLLAFAFVFASCSNGSDSDDDDSSTNGKPSSVAKVLPPSVGKNVLAGNSYKYSKEYDNETVTTTYEFKDDTVTETEVDQETGKSSETQIWEYKYTCNANTGLLYLNIVSYTRGGEKMTSMNELYEGFAKANDCTVAEAKEYLGDKNMFNEIISKCYFVKDDGNILLGNYFDDDEDIEGSKFVCADEAALIVNFDKEEIQLRNDYWKIGLDAKEKTFSGDEINGLYTVKKATKTLKDLNGDYKLRSEANGCITIKFSKLPATLTSLPYGMKIGTEYKFTFDLDCDEYKKL